MGFDFLLVDTAGLEQTKDESLAARMLKQSQTAAKESDVVLFVIDGRQGLTPTDRHFAQWLRKIGRPVILVANKCENLASELSAAEAARLGFGQPILLSAEHGLGLPDLADALAPYLEDSLAEEEDPTASLQIAVVGRPNVGKSTLVNQLLGQERVLTGPEAGITRDAITVDWEWKGHHLRLIDTAGLRKRGKVSERLEKLSGADTLHAINFAQIVILVVDAAAPLERQDLQIAEKIIEEGRGLVIAVNKWDQVTSPAKTLRLVKERVEDSLPRVKGVPVVTVTALSGRGLDKLMQAVFQVYGQWQRKLTTAELNRWLRRAESANPPPAPSGRRIRLKYMTQAKVRPPTFHLFATQFDQLPDSYLRYLENDLRDSFDMPATPLRLILRRVENPYRDRKPKDDER